jgi:tetratricopeptide (TPR) repeat protein
MPSQLSNFKFQIAGLAIMTLLGCADPAPPPPPPHVQGLDAYITGAQALNAGSEDKAQALLERAVRENPNLTMAHQLLGDLYRKNGDLNRAGDQYAMLVRLDPYSFKSHYEVGLTAQLLNRLDDAAAAYLRALALSPRDLNANMNLGLVYLALGHVDDAVRQLQLAVSINPKSAAAQCNLGVVLEAAGQLHKAETAYQRAVELDPNQTVAMIDLGSILVREDQGMEAAAVLKAAVLKTNTALVHKRLGDALVLQHQDDQAMDEYNAALHLDGRYWPAMNQIGLILVRKYQNGLTLDENLRLSAVAIWKKSLAVKPDQPQIQQWIVQWSQNGRVTP